VIEAYITNLGKYNEGELCGEYLKLPATKEDVQSLLARVGVDGVLYEETFITDYDTDIDGLHACLGEFESVDELNYLAALLDDMQDYERETFEAAVALGDDTGSVRALINLAQNLDCYDYLPGVSDDDELGRYLIGELECEEVPERLTILTTGSMGGTTLSMRAAYLRSTAISRRATDAPRNITAAGTTSPKNTGFSPIPSRRRKCQSGRSWTCTAAWYRRNSPLTGPFRLLKQRGDTQCRNK